VCSNFNVFPVHGSCNHFVVTVELGPSVLNGLAGLSLCLCVCVYIYVCIYIYIYIYNNLDLSMWWRKSCECIVRGRCNHFAVNADKVPFVVNGLAGFSLCVCVCLCIYMCV
jgi:hypothetical protein